jgi:Flp pilus assembly CpaE family ATPase
MIPLLRFHVRKKSNIHETKEQIKELHRIRDRKKLTLVINRSGPSADSNIQEIEEQIENRSSVRGSLLPDH